MSISNLSDAELEQKIEDARLKYKCALGINFFHTDNSLAALKNLEEFLDEQQRRWTKEKMQRQEIERKRRHDKETEEIRNRRPTNPSLADIPKFDAESHQIIIKELVGWALVSSDCGKYKSWTVYEFDLHLWLWVSRNYTHRRKDANYYFEGCSSITEEDLVHENAKTVLRLEGMSGERSETA